MHWASGYNLLEALERQARHSKETPISEFNLRDLAHVPSVLFCSR
jgi:hypothetical protein